jgi:hypothetical protein
MRTASISYGLQEDNVINQWFPIEAKSLLNKLEDGYFGGIFLGDVVDILAIMNGESGVLKKTWTA